MLSSHRLLRLFGFSAGKGEADYRILLLEEFAEPVFSFLLAVTALITIVVFAIVMLLGVLLVLLRCLLVLLLCLLLWLLVLLHGYSGFGSLDDFVKLTPVQPDTSALGAIINFNSITFAHDELSFVERAFHTSYIIRVNL